MEFVAKKEYEAFGRIDSFNTSDGIVNLVVTLFDDTQANIKLLIESDIEIGKVYFLKFTCQFNGTRNQLVLKEYKDIVECDLNEETEAVLKKFYAYVPVGIPALEEKLDYYLKEIKNPILSEITNEIIKEYRHDFLLYPAAVRMHHNYIGGLAYHTLTICDLAMPFVNVYSMLDKDLLIAGALLHDISKIIEFRSPTEDKYSIKGQLLGHLVLGAMEVERVAEKLGYKDSEEAMLLEHIIISHHGNPQFGACKRPETPEALLLWLVDTADSKLRVIEETFEKIEPGRFTDNIAVLDKTKCYKKK